MSSTPRVSFLLAVYNDGRYLEETLAGIFSQTFGDFELVAVDDASTDGTAALLQATGDERVRYVRNDSNLGHVGSLSRGLKMCRGEYIARIDGDDICEPTRLEQQVVLLDRDASLAGCATWTTEIDDEGQPIGIKAKPYPDASHVTWSMGHGLQLYHPTMTLRRTALEAVGGYDTTTLAMEDYDLWTRMVAGGHLLGVVPEQLVRYRRRRGSITAKYASHQQAQAVPVAKRYIETLLGHKADAAAIATMRKLYSWDDLAPLNTRPALRLMQQWRRATLGDADQAARQHADDLTGKALLRRATAWLKHDPAAALCIARYLMRLPGHRRRGLSLWIEAARAAAGRLRSGHD